MTPSIKTVEYLLGKPLNCIPEVPPLPPVWKKFKLVAPLFNILPRKKSLDFSISYLSKTSTYVPTVDLDCAFWLGAITIIGMSAENTGFNKIKEIRKKTNIFIARSI